MSKMKYAFLLALAPVMMGSDYNEDDIAQNLAALKVTGKLPVCKTGEFLTYQGGSLVCAFPPGNGISGLTKCEGQLLTNTGAGGEFKTLSCTPKGGASISNSDITRVTTLKNNVDTLNTTVNNLNAASPSRGYYVGLSTATTIGQIKVANVDVGMASAGAICQSYGPKAHVCSVYEIYSSSAAGKDLTTLTNINAWVYNSSWNKPLANPAEPDRGTAESCNDMTYTSGHLFWNGTVASYGALPTGGNGLKFLTMGCPTTLRAACCN